MELEYSSNLENINIYPVFKALSKSMDLISNNVVGHHQKVAYISLKLGEKLNLSNKEKQKLVLASLIHDLGVFYLNQNFSELSFDSKDNKHAEVGYKMAQNFIPDPEITRIIKYHHHEFNVKKKNVPYLSDIIHLADRIAVLIKKDENILKQTSHIKKIIKENSKRFLPEAKKEFFNLSNYEYFWLDVSSSSRIERKLNSFFEPSHWHISLNELKDIGILISHIIDFRSSFTATHSTGVSITSSKLAEYFNFDDTNCKIMKIAGYFHDIGKLIVPPHILNKPEKLNENEWKIMKSHTYYTYYSLDTTKKLDKIKKWAAFHHEKLNGKGYPFHLKENNISFGSKIMAAADVFTAITEDRPYRKGMKYETVKKVLTEMGENKELDGKISQTIVDHFTEFNSARYKHQKQAQEYFKNFQKEINNI